MKKKHDYEVALVYDKNALTWATGDSPEELENNIKRTVEFHNWDMDKVEVYDRRWAGKEMKNEKRKV